MPAGVAIPLQNKAARPKPRRKKMASLLVRPARLERATSWFVARRSIQLSYGREGAAHILTISTDMSDTKQ
jgi:hypothetical protein